MSASTTSAPAGDLRGLAARGTLVNAAFEIGLTSLALVKGFIVAAFLSRSEYGIWEILIVVLVSLLWLNRSGSGTSTSSSARATSSSRSRRRSRSSWPSTGCSSSCWRRRSRSRRWSTASRT